MTYRCVDCVFSEVNDKKFCDMTCLKHRKTVKCMEIHCDDLILRPFQFIAHLCYVHNYHLVKKGKMDWSKADEMAKEHLDEHGFAGMKTPDKLLLFENTSGKTADEPKEEYK